MNGGPKTPDDAGAIVQALTGRGVKVIVAGHWAIEAFSAHNPSAEARAWLKEHTAMGPLDLACPFDDRALAETALAVLGFVFRGQIDGSSHFDNDQEVTVRVDYFRPSRDGGRIYPKLGPDGKDWYYPPETVCIGRLGALKVYTEAPIERVKPREARADDEA